MRGYIESFIDGFLEVVRISKRIEWVLEEIPISSVKDLMLGYTIGVLQATNESITMQHPKFNSEKILDYKKDIVGIIKRRIPEISDIIERELNV